MAYSEAFSAVYDSFTGNVSYGERAVYINELLKKNGITPCTMLDLACGTGSLAAEFCTKGYELVCVDSSCDMLMSAREKLSAYGSRALILCQDMLTLDLYGTVGCAVCSLDSINHLADEKQVQQVFNRVAMFTEPGGVFVFDVNTLYKHRNVLCDNTFVFEDENAFLVWQNSLCENGCTVDIMLDIFIKEKNGAYTRQSEDFSETAYACEKIEAMLKKAGFEQICMYGDMSFSAPEQNEERVYFSAVKKK